MQCNWIQINERQFECQRCGRSLVIPEGLPVAPNFDALPPCGWRPETVSANGHKWYEIYNSNPKTYTCPKCKARTEKPLEYASPCIARAGTTSMAARYAEAVARWTAAGFPLRTMEEVRKIYAICLQCPHYNKKRETCRLCGCRCNTSTIPLINKIRMATEQCPDNPPRWLAKVRP